MTVKELVGMVSTIKYYKTFFNPEHFSDQEINEEKIEVPIDKCREIVTLFDQVLMFVNITNVSP